MADTCYCVYLLRAFLPSAKVALLFLLETTVEQADPSIRCVFDRNQAASRTEDGAIVAYLPGPVGTVSCAGTLQRFF